MRILTEGEVIVENAKVANNEGSQFDRVEKKVDRILHILENRELSTSYVSDFTIPRDRTLP